MGRFPQAPSLSPFAIGIFYGHTKPSNPEEFLHDFVQEAKGLQGSGICYNDHHYNFCIVSFVCDTPARAYIKGTKGHLEYSACDKCTTEGDFGMYDKMTFPELNAPLRTDTSFDEMVDEDDHVRPCPLNGLRLGMVSQFPLDHMHLICLGVMRRLMHFWMKGPHCRLSVSTKTEISECLLSLCRYVPKEFARKPRSLNELD